MLGLLCEGSDSESSHERSRVRFLFGALLPAGKGTLLDEHSTLARTQSEHGRNGSHRLLLRRHLSQALLTLVGSLRPSGVDVSNEGMDVISRT